MKEKLIKFLVGNIFRIVGSLTIFIVLILFVGFRYSLALLSIGLLYWFFDYSFRNPIIRLDIDDENDVNKKEEK